MASPGLPCTHLCNRSHLHSWAPDGIHNAEQEYCRNGCAEQGGRVQPGAGLYLVLTALMVHGNALPAMPDNPEKAAQGQRLD